MDNHNSELQSLVLEIAKQNILLGQRIDAQGQGMAQRIDTLTQSMAQQNIQLTQTILEQNRRMDAAIQQTQQQQTEIVKMFYQIYGALEKLPDVVKDQIGFTAKT